VHVPFWSGAGRQRVEEQLAAILGIRRVDASPLTRNILVTFDPARTDVRALLGALRGIDWPAAVPPTPIRVDTPVVPAVVSETREGGRQARIAVQGINRNPNLVRRVIDTLHRLQGVRVRVKPLTGHVVIEYDQRRVVFDDVMAKIAHLDLPEGPGEDRPAHPLDPGPLLQGITRTLGSLIGLLAITARRLANPTPAISNGTGWAPNAVGVTHLIQAFPFVRTSLQRVMGRNAASLVPSVLSIAATAVANFPLGMLVCGVEAVIFLTEVTARRAAWRRYQEGLESAPSIEPGAVVRIEPGMSMPRTARVIEGIGTATGASGLPSPVAPGDTVPAGAVMYGGPFVVELQEGEPFTPQPRPAPLAPGMYDHYHRYGGAATLAFAVLAAFRTGSLTRIFEALLLTNPRTAVVGLEAANLQAATRALRGGMTVVGTRPERQILLPKVVLLDGPQLLTDGLEVVDVVPLVADLGFDDLLGLAEAVSAAAGSPWGDLFPTHGQFRGTGGEFTGLWASASIGGDRHILGPPEDDPELPDWFEEEHRAGYLLSLFRESDQRTLGYIALRRRLREGIDRLVATCQRLGVTLELVPATAPLAAQVVAARTGLQVARTANTLTAIDDYQRTGAAVMLVSDHAGAEAGFAACDLAVGILSRHTGEFPARADLLAPDLRAVADLLDTAARRQAVVDNSVLLSVAANVLGGVFSLFQGTLGVERATYGIHLAAVAAMGIGWARLRGGHRPRSTLAFLADPRPERWGRTSTLEVLRAFTTTPAGLTRAEAASRRPPTVPTGMGDAFLNALFNQLRAPITCVLAGGACLTLVLGQPLNTAVIALTISLNVAAGIWQEREIGMAAEALSRMGAGSARLLRDGETTTVPVAEVVPGDILVLAPGDRVAADARLLETAGLEVGEAALTGESLPVVKGPDANAESDRIILEGSDIIAGTGRAVVVAVGKYTRLGATTAALSVDKGEVSPMGLRLGQILNVALPLSFSGGAVAGLAGWVWGNPWMNQLTIGVTTALSAIPEGLPLLAGVGQAGAARRLSHRGVLVRRIAAVEALGRVDVACTDKTGTLTEGRLAVRVIADETDEAAMPGPLTPELRRLLLTAGLACPHPDAPFATTHPTDFAVIHVAHGAGLGNELRAERLGEVPFDSARAYYISRVAGRVCAKGAPERLLARCTHFRRNGALVPFCDIDRTEWLIRVTAFAERGMRVLLVVEGPADANLYDPRGLTAVGFIGITDPLRASVPDAVRRCQAAGVRVLMLTGDHPATGRTIAREAGLFAAGRSEVVRASELASLSDDELDHRLQRISVIARAAPLDKLRIVQSLQRRGHVVAMTGDGVNDAPALRLADVGVAMGKSGTEVARQASDVVLLEDDFAALVEALVEGRGFWGNMRNALGLLLGGNTGELGLIVGGSLLGFGPPLNPVQILLVNLITDALPCVAVVLQGPQHRNLAGLAREGVSALDRSIRMDVIRRGIATALPSLAAYALMRGMGGVEPASAVGFASVISTQLAQTIDMGRVEGTLSKSVASAVAGSLALMAGCIVVPPVAGVFGLVSPGVAGWGLIGASAAGAVVVSRAIPHGALDAALALAQRAIPGRLAIGTTAPKLLLPSTPLA
jgi:magnesium-transporting ATPase (P-type)